MNEVSLLDSLGQVSASETGHVFRDFLRGHVREMICEVMLRADHGEKMADKMCIRIIEF